MTIEVQVARRWVPLTVVARVSENGFALRGFSSGDNVTLGRVGVGHVNGTVEVRLNDIEDLRCHVGLLEVAIDGQPVGEVDIVPGKLTTAAWDHLRAELQQVWTGLIFEDEAPTALSAQFTTWPPDSAALWAAIAPVIADLEARPVATLSLTEQWVRRERVRSPSQLSHSVLMAGLRGRPGRARALSEVTSEPERALVRDCLERLYGLASRDPKAHATAAAIARSLSVGLYSRPSTSKPTVTHLARHEPRLRQVVALRQKLLNPLGVITEGPGELRLGVGGIDLLYEFWVFLTVLRSLQQQFGDPVGAGFDQLGVRLPGKKVRLTLPAGTAVEFPGRITAVFNPSISQAAIRSWMGLELSALPSGLPVSTPLSITPDVVVLKELEDGRSEAVVLDAKYRVRERIDAALWEIHHKYGRIRLRGRGVVREVIAAHPHRDFTLTWAGQRAIPFVPGEGIPEALWPSEWIEAPTDATSSVESESTSQETRSSTSPDLTASDDDEEVSEAPSTSVALDRPPTNTGEPPVINGVTVTVASRRPSDLVICDQQWTAGAIGAGRLDLQQLRQRLVAAGGTAVMIGSELGTRRAFHGAARSRGWSVVVAESREDVLAAAAEALDAAPESSVVLIGGLVDLAEYLRRRVPELTVVTDVTELVH